MIEADYYPPGAYNDPDAPWNEKTEKVSVTVSITMSKDFTIEVPDDIALDEETLKYYVEQQIYLPQEAGLHIDSKLIANDLSDWYVDDFTVIHND